MDLLVNREANVNLYTKNESSPLSIAIQSGHVNVANRLVNKGADLNALNKINLVPLFADCRRGQSIFVDVTFGKKMH